MVKVSVIVPIYNSEFFLERCINSIINQTLKEIEIILVDDASTDNSYFIMQSFKTLYPERIKLIKSEVNGKQGTARNKGLDIATGEYIGFVDSDDWISPHKYEKLYNVAIENSSVIVDSDYAKAEGVGKIIEEVISIPAQYTDTYQRNTNEIIMQPGYIWTKIFKRSFIEKYKFRFPENIFYEDNEFLPIVLAMANRIDKVNEVLSFYHFHIESTVNKQESFHVFERLPTAIGMVNQFKKYNFYNKYEEAVEARFIELYYATTITICLNNFKKTPIQYLYEIRKYMKTNYPNYRKNKYFKKRASNRVKARTKINDISPILITRLHSLMRGKNKYIIK